MRKNILIFLILCVIILGNTGCLHEPGGSLSMAPFQSFRDIPGITSEEIEGIEALQRKYDSFSYGMFQSTEAFVRDDGTAGGYAALFCDWLTGLFGIPFKVEFYNSLELFDKLDNHELDFQGSITPTEERKDIYFMTDIIAERKFITVRLKDSRSPNNISIPRYAYARQSPVGNAIASLVESGTYESVYAGNFFEAYEILKTNKADAYVATSIAESIFFDYDDLVIEDFYPLIFNPAVMGAAKTRPELGVVIDIVNKALRNGGSRYLTDLYKQGYMDFKKYKVSNLLTDEERAYIAANPVIPVAAYIYNYPLSFYNAREDEWQGIYFDILDEISELTGLNFEVGYDWREPYAEVSEKFLRGDLYIIPEWMNTAEEGIIWSDIPIMEDYYALISRSDFPIITLNEIQYVRVGLMRNTTHTRMFRQWFPNHPNCEEYANIETALLSGEVDMIMSTQRRLMHLTHFQEQPGYKVNVLFNQPIETRFAANASHAVLLGIIDKTLKLMDYKGLAYYWMHKTHDYRLRMTQMRLPWFIGVTALSLVILALVLIIFFRNKKMSAALKIAKEQAEQNNRAKGIFLANMSHEIRTPMNAILGITEIQLRNDSIPQDTEEALHKIYESGNLLLHIINDILDLSKIDAGKLELIPVEYDIPSLINDIVQINLMRYESKPIEFKLNVDKNTPVKLYGDEFRIKQILNNILSNAFKYTDAGIVSLSVWIETEEQNNESTALIFRVSDTGQGMRDDQIKRLFDEYSRFNLETNRGISGTGLGMSITKRLVDVMNGEILVESEPGKGSVFTVRLPQKTAGKDVCGTELTERLHNFSFHSSSFLKKSHIIHEYMPYGRVLVVDDVESNLYVAKGLLIPYGLQVETAVSGFEAVEKIRKGKTYDLIFMDHMMPKMDGIEAVRQIRTIENDSSLFHVPIIALTANVIVGQAEVFFANDFDGFLSKPIDSRELNHLLNSFIRDKAPPEVVEKARQEKQKKIQKIKSSELEKFFILDTEKAVKILKEIYLKLQETQILSEEDTESYIVAVHGMKNVLINIGETDNAAASLRLENAGREKNFAIMLEETPAFIHELQSLIGKYKSERKNPIASDTELFSEDLAYLREKLNVIKTACDTLDKKSAKKALGDLKQKKWSHAVNDILDEITVLLLHSDFKNTVKLAEQAVQLTDNRHKVISKN